MCEKANCSFADSWFATEAEIVADDHVAVAGANGADNGSMALVRLALAQYVHVPLV